MKKFMVTTLHGARLKRTTSTDMHGRILSPTGSQGKQDTIGIITNIAAMGMLSL